MLDANGTGFSKTAAEEIAEAAAWYERQRPGLAVDFNGAIDAALDLLEEELVPLAPAALSAAQHGAKRLILKRFPYDVVVRGRATRYWLLL